MDKPIEVWLAYPGQVLKGYLFQDPTGQKTVVDEHGLARIHGWDRDLPLPDTVCTSATEARQKSIAWLEKEIARMQAQIERLEAERD